MAALLAAAHYQWPAAITSGALACLATFALIRIQNRTTTRQAGPWPTAAVTCLAGIVLAAAAARGEVQMVHFAEHDAVKESASLMLFAVGTVLAVGGGYSAWLWTGSDRAR